MKSFTHLDYLDRERALVHSQAARNGAGRVEIGNYLVASARWYQAMRSYENAEHLLEAAADAYSELPDT